MENSYSEFEVLPANWSRTVWSGGKLVNEADPFKWGGKSEPPPIGAKVKVMMNGIGAGVVVRYFVEHGYLGVLVRPKKAPAWYVKQNGRYALCHVFGTEMTPEPTA